VKKTTILVTTQNEEDRDFFISALSVHDDLEIVAIEKDEAGAVIKSGQFKPDILIFDICLPGIDGVEIAPLVHRRSPATSIILISDKDENAYAGKALRAGISGFMLKNADMNKLLPVVRIVGLGGYFISTSVTRRAIEKKTEVKQLFSIPSFSSSERNIIIEIARGFSDKEIAEHLNYSTGTIKNCVTAIKRKTRLKNRVQIALYSFVCGVVGLDQLEFLRDNASEVKHGKANIP
jgi:DNA-binding NarL/FixJ family response regulator